jgi:hypothetical protein
MYSEVESEMTVDPEINNVEKKDLINFIKEFVDLSTKTIGENADYFFIREIRDNFGYENEPAVTDFLLNLNYKQFEYIMDRRTEIEQEKSLFSVKNSEVVKPTINALIYLLTVIISKTDAIKVVDSIVRKNQEKYDFLKYINIKIVYGKDEDDSSYTITLEDEIDNVKSNEIAEFLETIIEEAGKSFEWIKGRSLLEDFKIVVGHDSFINMKRIGINFNKIDKSIQHQNKNVSKSVLEALLDILILKTSKEQAGTILGDVLALSELHDTYNVLNHIKINTPEDNKQIISFNISNEINFIPPYKLGKAFREIIKIIQEHLKDETFVEEFKERLGEEYLNEIDKLGINLYFLELQFR